MKSEFWTGRPRHWAALAAGAVAAAAAAGVVVWLQTRPLVIEAGVEREPAFSTALRVGAVEAEAGTADVPAPALRDEADREPASVDPLAVEPDAGGAAPRAAVADVAPSRPGRTMPAAPASAAGVPTGEPELQPTDAPATPRRLPESSGADKPAAELATAGGVPGRAPAPPADRTPQAPAAAPAVPPDESLALEIAALAVPLRRGASSPPSAGGESVVPERLSPAPAVESRSPTGAAGASAGAAAREPAASDPAPNGRGPDVSHTADSPAAVAALVSPQPRSPAPNPVSSGTTSAVTPPPPAPATDTDEGPASAAGSETGTAAREPEAPDAAPNGSGPRRSPATDTPGTEVAALDALPARDAAVAAREPGLPEAPPNGSGPRRAPAIDAPAEEVEPLDARRAGDGSRPAALRGEDPTTPAAVELAAVGSDAATGLPFRGEAAGAHADPTAPRAEGSVDSAVSVLDSAAAARDGFAVLAEPTAGPVGAVGGADSVTPTPVDAAGAILAASPAGPSRRAEADGAFLRLPVPTGPGTETGADTLPPRLDAAPDLRGAGAEPLMAAAPQAAGTVVAAAADVGGGTLAIRGGDAPLKARSEDIGPRATAGDALPGPGEAPPPANAENGRRLAALASDGGEAGLKIETEAVESWSDGEGVTAAPAAPAATRAVSASGQRLAARAADGGKGVSRLREGGEPEAETAALSLEVIDYDRSGDVGLSGTAIPGTLVVAYLDNRPVGSVAVAPDGSWRLAPDAALEPGLYALRIDLVGAKGVVTRLETPFTFSDMRTANAAEGLVVVQVGSNLWRIAKRVYGRGARNMSIYEANRDQIRDPDMIFPGQILILPGVAAEG